MALARLARFERATHGSGGRCSVRAELQARVPSLPGDSHRRSQALVGVSGFEPLTPCAQGRCAARLRHTPTPDSTYRGRGSAADPAARAARNGRQASRARARWLIRFFAAGPASARVCESSGTKKMGSYPNPAVPSAS